MTDATEASTNASSTLPEKQALREKHAACSISPLPHITGTTAAWAPSVNNQL